MINKLIILEGVDGSGKTTLYNQLCNIYGCNCYPFPPRNGTVEDIERYVNTLLCKIFMKQGTQITDRSIISDIVYRMYDLDPSQKIYPRTLCTLLDNSIIVYCTSKTAFEDAQKRGEDNITSKTAHNILATNYCKTLFILQRYFGAKVINYDWHNKECDALWKEMNAYCGGDNIEPKTKRNCMDCRKSSADPTNSI